MEPLKGWLRKTWTTDSPWLGIGLLSVVAIAVRGYYGFGVGDQALYLPFLYHWHNPSLFAHDYLLSLPWIHDSILWPTLSLFQRWMALKLVFFVLYLVATYVSLFFIFKIAKTVWTNRTAAWIAVFLWLPAYQIPGADIGTFDSYFTGRCLAMALVLAAVYLFLNGRFRWTWILLTLGIFIHIISVVPVVCGMFLALVLERRWRDCFEGVLVSGLASGLMAVFAKLQGAHQEIWTFYSGVRFKFLWHTLPDVFPQSWVPSTWMEIGLYTVAFGLVVLVSRRLHPFSAGERRLYSLAAGAVILTFLGLTGAYAGFALAAQLCLARSYFWVIFVLVVWLAGWIASGLRDHRWRRILLALYLMATWITGAVGSHVMVVAIVAILQLCSRAGGEERLCWPGRIGLTVLILLQAFWMIILSPRGINWPAEGLPFGLVFSCLALVTARFGGGKAHEKMVRRMPVFVGCAFIVTLFLLPPTSFIITSGMRPVLAPFVPALKIGYVKSEAYKTNKTSMGRIYDMVSRNVPIGATVLVNPLWRNFRIKTMRSSFVTLKDHSGLLYDAGFAREWIRRMRLIKAYPKGKWKLDDRINLTEQELLDLAAEYRSIRLEYIVTTRFYNLPVVDRVGPWTLYRLPIPPLEQDERNEG